MRVGLCKQGLCLGLEGLHGDGAGGEAGRGFVEPRELHEGGGELGGVATLLAIHAASVDAALDGVGLAYTFEQLARPNIRAKKLKRVLGSFSPTFPGFYLYYPSRRQQPSKMKALVDYALAHSRKR